jgi:hypothetical protein
MNPHSMNLRSRVERQMHHGDMDSRESWFCRRAERATLSASSPAWSTEMSKTQWDYSQHTAATASHEVSQPKPERSRPSHGRVVAVLLIAALCACFEREISGPTEGGILPVVAKYWQAAKALTPAPTR